MIPEIVEGATALHFALSKELLRNSIGGVSLLGK